MHDLVDDDDDDEVIIVEDNLSAPKKYPEDKATRLERSLKKSPYAIGRSGLIGTSIYKPRKKSRRRFGDHRRMTLPS